MLSDKRVPLLFCWYFMLVKGFQFVVETKYSGSFLCVIKLANLAQLDSKWSQITQKWIFYHNVHTVWWLYTPEVKKSPKSQVGCYLTNKNTRNTMLFALYFYLNFSCLTWNDNLAFCNSPFKIYFYFVHRDCLSILCVVTNIVHNCNVWHDIQNL